MYQGKKIAHNIIITILLFLVVIFRSVAQSDARRSPDAKITFNEKALKQLKKDHQKSFNRNHKEALRLAEDKNWEIIRELPRGGVLKLHSIDRKGNPVYYKTFSSEAASTTSTDKVWDGGVSGLFLSGNSELVSNRLGIWDGGPVRRTHQELSGRVTQEDNAGNSWSDHATHVAGIMVGTGVNSQAKGMAYQADLRAWDWDNDISEMSEAAADGLLLSNHSYGLGNVGWVYNSSRFGSVQWEWWGDTDISDFEDYRFGYYDEYAQQVDEIANNAPYYLVTVAAGNDRTSSGPGTGNRYYLKSTNTTSTVERRDQDSFDLITSYGLAKNVLTVGAIHPIEGGFQESTEAELAYFSSLGPTDDGRIKPDIVADGWEVLSSVATSNQAYDSYSGTSMAAPNVTGSLQLLQEYHAQLYDGNFLKAATLKGLVIHASDDTGNEGPDYTFGWGVLNTARAAEVIRDQGDLYSLEERTLVQDAVDTIHVIASGSEALKVTISWNDPFASPLEIDELVVNNRTPLLVNDLDIKVIGQDSTFYPWILNPDFPSASATTGNNFRDNVEQVIIGNSVPGASYQVVISHKNNLVNGSQDYSLIIGGQGGQPYCASIPENEGGPSISEIHFGSLDYLTDACEETDGLLALEAAISYKQDGDVPFVLNSGFCDGISQEQYIRVFIDWNKDFDFEDEGESILFEMLPEGENNLSTSFSLPDGLSAGTSTRMRVITTNDPEATSCGVYDSGQTMDITIRFTKPQYDITPLALVTPDESSCSNTLLPLQVRVANEGTEEVSEIPLSVLVSANGEQQTFQDTIQSIILPGEEKILSLAHFVTLLPDTEYSASVYTNLSAEQYRTNDSLTTSFFSKSQVMLSNARAFICDEESIRLLSDDQYTFWYTEVDQREPVGYGPSVVLDEWPADSTFYAAVNDLNVSLGPRDKYEFDGGSYGAGYVPEPLISTKVPVILDSARLYIGYPGTLVFNLIDVSGETVSSVEVEVEATRETSVSGDADDDLNDEGAMYYIGLEFPEPGNYRIQMEYHDDASIFRSNEGVSGFPFQASDIITLHGALYDGDTLTDAYYYLYDMQFSSLDCGSERIPVKAQTGPQISNQITSEVTSSCNTPIQLNATEYGDHIYEWSKDGEVVQLSSSPVYEAAVSGEYGLTISNDQCVYSPSNTITVDISNLEKPEFMVFDENLLVSSSSTGNQWYLDGEPIAGATDMEFEAVIAGYYKLQVSENECVVFSDEKLVYVDPPVEEGIWIYPNPAESIVTVRLRQFSDEPNLSMTLYDIAGNELLRFPMTFLFEDIYEARVDVSVLRSGVYLLKAPQRSDDWVKKLIKR